MLLQEDGIWITESERLYLLKFGVSAPGVNERQIFEAALPEALKLSDTLTDEDFLIPDNPRLGDGDPTDRLREIGRIELRVAGVYLPESFDLDVPEDTEPLNTQDRYKLPIKLAPALVKLFASELIWHEVLDENEENARRTRQNTIRLLAIIPPSLREELFGR